MHYVPFSVIKSIHEQTHSAMPNAPVRPYVPQRRPLRAAVRRLLQRQAQPAPAPQPAPTPASAPRAALTLVASELSADQLCEAEVRDRGTTPPGVARAG
ncbi:hypothetical protein AB0E63_16305 [Kribbella sp. NPDC026596]|uniref:hypothetical protein n=1 Tax=Kribbella sp. NPDC026596 TaxID=3155122 RepID=UPI0033CD802A